MIIKFLAQNIKRGGHLDDDNQPEERWDSIVARVQSEAPDFLLLSEVVGWDRDGYSDVGRAMEAFNMAALPIAPSSNGYPTLLMYNSATVGHWKYWNTGFADQTVHGFGIAAFDVGLPDLLSVVPVHIGPFTHQQVLNDTALIAKRGYRYGRFTVLGGDFNLAPLRDPAPDESQIGSTHEFRYKAVKDEATQTLRVELNRDPALAMIQADYVDCADLLFDKTGDRSHLLPTTDDAGRIDRYYVTQPMREAVASYRCLVDTAVSDHAGIALTLDTDKIDTDYKFSIEEFTTRKHLI